MPDPCGVVLLIKSARVLERGHAELAFSEALPHLELEVDKYGDAGWMAEGGGWMFTLLPIEDQYLPPSHAKERRARRALEEASAALLVDVWEAPDGVDRFTAGLDEAGKLAAVFIDDDTTAMVAVGGSVLNLATPDAKEALAAGRATEFFARCNYDGVVDRDHDDSEFAGQLAEAKRRWPEFGPLFAQTGKGLVKAAFEGPEGTEHMWIEVRSYADGQVEGKLLNRPLNVPFLKVGSRVTVDESVVSDWRCGDVGPFTE